MASYEHDTRQERQGRYIKELDTLKQKHSKISQSRWTQQYLQTLNTNLRDWWDKFQLNYEKLIEVARRRNICTDNYFKDYDSTRNDYIQFEESLRFPNLKDLKNSIIQELCDEYILVPKTKRNSDRISRKMIKKSDNQQSKAKNVPPKHVVVQTISSSSTSIDDFAGIHKTTTSTTTKSYTRKTSEIPRTAEGPAPKKFKSGNLIIFGKFC